MSLVKDVYNNRMRAYSTNMNFKKAYELMDIELQCVRRNSAGICDRKCEKCDLVQKDTDLIEAYQMARFALQKLISEE